MRGEALADRVKALVHEGNVRRITIRNDEGRAGRRDPRSQLVSSRPLPRQCWLLSRRSRRCRRTAGKSRLTGHRCARRAPTRLARRRSKHQRSERHAAPRRAGRGSGRSGCGRSAGQVGRGGASDLFASTSETVRGSGLAARGRQRPRVCDRPAEGQRRSSTNVSAPPTPKGLKANFTTASGAATACQAPTAPS